MKNYANEEIFKMLLPKLKKHYPDIEHQIVKDCVDWGFLLSLCYKSGYIRGQLGRSFIIEERKSKPKFEQTERWVPATGIKLQTGDKVRLANKNFYRAPWFPKNGTVGVVIASNMYSTVVQWPEGSTSRNNRWNMSPEHLEVLLCE